MNSAEMNKWIKEHSRWFPTVRAKLKENPDIVELWRRVLSDVQLEDALLVSESMGTGELEPPAAYEWDRLAAIVLRECKQLEYARLPDSESVSRYEIQEPMGSLGKAYRAFLSVLDDGGTEQEAKAKMGEILMVDSTGREESFRCLECRDTGLVTVWSFESVRAFMTNQTGGNSWKQSMSAPCCCDKGEKFVRTEFKSTAEQKNWRGWKSHSVRFADERYARLFNSNPLHPDSLPFLEEFVRKIRNWETPYVYNGETRESRRAAEDGRPYDQGEMF